MSCKCSLCSDCMQKAMAAIHMLGSIEERIIVKNKAIQELESKVEALEETVQLQHISMVTAQTYSNHIEKEFENYKILKKAEVEGIGSELLALQQENIKTRKYLNKLEKILMAQGTIPTPPCCNTVEMVDAWRERNKTCLRVLED